MISCYYDDYMSKKMLLTADSASDKAGASRILLCLKLFGTKTGLGHKDYLLSLHLFGDKDRRRLAVLL